MSSSDRTVTESNVALELPRFADAWTRGWILTAAIACVFMAAIEGTVVATAMPTIVSKLGDFHLFSWVFSSYFLAQAVTIPLGGRFADLFGRKKILYFGLGLFLVGSSSCGFAPNMVMLIVCRIVQGVGAGAMMPAAQTLISDIYPPAIRARMQGYLSSVWAGAAICGPLLGAFLVATLSWRWIFWVNVPLGLVAILLLTLMLHEHTERRPHRIDYLGSALMALGVGTLIFALIQATSIGAVACIALVAVAAVMLSLLYFQERRAAEPVMPLRLWRNRVVLASNIACLTVGCITISASAFLPAYVQGVMGRSPLIAGYVVSTSSVAWMFGSAAGGKIMLRYSYRLAATIGSCLVIGGSLTLIMLSPQHGPLWAATGTALTGLGMGLFQNTFFLAAQASVERSDRGSATASVLFSRILGQTIGAALFGGIVNIGLADHIGGDAVTRIMDPALRNAFPAAEIAPLMLAIANALRHVFLAAGFLALVGLAATLGLPRGLSPAKQTGR